MPKGNNRAARRRRAKPATSLPWGFGPGSFKKNMRFGQRATSPIQDIIDDVKAGILQSTTTDEKPNPMETNTDG